MGFDEDSELNAYLEERTFKLLEKGEFCIFLGQKIKNASFLYECISLGMVDKGIKIANSLDILSVNKVRNALKILMDEYKGNGNFCNLEILLNLSKILSSRDLAELAAYGLNSLDMDGFTLRMQETKKRIKLFSFPKFPKNTPSTLPYKQESNEKLKIAFVRTLPK